MPEGDRILIARNRRAQFDYEIVDTREAGIALRGPEVKSLRAGHANLGDAYASVRRGETYLHNLHIGPYEPARLENADPLRERNLLLHRSHNERLKQLQIIQEARLRDIESAQETYFFAKKITIVILRNLLKTVFKYK